VPHISDLCLARPTLQPTTFRETERPTTTKSISTPFIDRGLPYLNQKYESDVSLTPGTGSSSKPEYFLGLSQNTGSINQADRGGYEWGNKTSAHPELRNSIRGAKQLKDKHLTRYTENNLLTEI